jgi:hypothetical protein
VNWYAIIAVAGIVVLAVAEILISVKKLQMKRQFLEELNHQEMEKSEQSKTLSDDSKEY